MRVKHATRAQAVLEFAFVVPMFALLLFGLIDFSRLLFTYISISNGAREMARVAAESYNWSSTNPAAAINAFNNYTVIAGSQNSSTDNIQIQYGDLECARALDTGTSCASSAPDNMTTTTCTLPLSTSSCTFSAPPQGGFVQVQVSYTFRFNPLFQNRLDGVMDVSFMNPTAQVTTTSRAYVE
jgi:Flp pilus assembly protein TadG